MIDTKFTDAQILTLLDFFERRNDAEIRSMVTDNADVPTIFEYVLAILLIEATLADSTNQRRMEMEPVSRHLGQHLIRSGDTHSYCVFATNFLNINVISDFRSRKNTYYYDTQDYTRYVAGMKIIPLEISELKRIVKVSKTYRELYPIFDAAFNSPIPPHMWYESCIKNSV